jgi:hypothetical protein
MDRVKANAEGGRMKEECGMKDRLLFIHHCGIPPSSILLILTILSILFRF